MEDEPRMRACVVVLGDWGRSPRMQYHALSLAKNGFTVDVVAYGGSDPHEDVRDNKYISHHYLMKVPAIDKYCPRLLFYVFKTLWQAFFLITTLFCLSKPNILLLQNPPSIPTLPCCWFYCWLRGVSFIIDFHNYGYTLLALSLGQDHRLVRICKWCEEYFGQRASHNLCVSSAMKKDLLKNWGICSTVFYDCPPEIFHPISIEEKHAFFLKLKHKHSVFQESPDNEEEGVDCTRFTIKKRKSVVSLKKRPVLIVSSTSWTEDEDFSILLLALTKYEEAANTNPELPDLVVAITGKGPLRSMYEKLIEEKNFTHVEIITLWLAAEDYPTMLGCADVGISLHCSTSGLDLPMKVVDMFGCGLPVCSYYYPCVQELVKEKENGLWFLNGKQLALRLQMLLKNFPEGVNELHSYRQQLLKHPLPRWDRTWNDCVLPIVQLMS